MKSTDIIDKIIQRKIRLEARSNKNRLSVSRISPEKLKKQHKFIPFLKERNHLGKLLQSKASRVHKPKYVIKKIPDNRFKIKVKKRNPNISYKSFYRNRQKRELQLLGKVVDNITNKSLREKRQANLYRSRTNKSSNRNNYNNIPKKHQRGRSLNLLFRLTHVKEKEDDKVQQSLQNSIMSDFR
ncbi:unnamed protein product [Moneuplotes crassus]|uniref:Uncharacterized protein n=1 Tax=Euplotes crassus TaxID=5936 RepID=A0AAD1XUL2_EUPCR|nr:unnamed protein product [Moneuplotes crassus]